MSVQERTRWLPISLLVLVGIAAAMEFAKVSTVFADVAEHYQASQALAAWFVSLPALSTIVFGLTGSVIAARIGFRRVLVLSLGLAVIVSLLQALLLPLPLFVATRAIDGVVQLGLVIACPVLIIEFAAARHRALAMSIWGTFFGLAFAIAGWLAPPIAAVWGIGAVFAAHAGFALVLLLAVALALPRVAGDGPQAEVRSEGFVRAHLEAYREPRAFLPGAIFIFHTALYAVFVLFIPMFVDPSVSAALLVWMPLVSIVGTVAAGVLVQSFASPPGVLIAGYLGLAASILLIWLSLGSPELALMMPLLLMFCAGLIQGASFSLIPALSTDPAMTSRANGVLMQLGNLGTLLGPPLFGLLIGTAEAGQFARFSVPAWALVAGGLLMSVVALRYLARRANTDAQQTA